MTGCVRALAFWIADRPLARIRLAVVRLPLRFRAPRRPSRASHAPRALSATTLRPGRALAAVARTSPAPSISP
jgi:hypothetical protein